MNKVIKNPTYFVDIDGTIIKYRKFSELGQTTPEPIQDVIDFFAIEKRKMGDPLFVGDLMFDRGIRYYAKMNGGNNFIFEFFFINFFKN